MSNDIGAGRIESDQPIQKSTEDRFGRWSFALRIAEVIAKRADPSSIVIGVHAPWGEGKTSVLNMIVEGLGRQSHVEYLRFNPWRFPAEAQLLKHFFTVLADKLDSSIIETGEKVGAWLRKYADALAPLSAFGIDANDALKAAGEALPEADLEQLKERLEGILSASAKRLVVIMDDIDRLDKEEIQAVFRLVKLSADFPNTAYILAFDELMVATALSDKYGGVEAGRNFLEKIIQVSLPLPPASPQALMALTIEGVKGALQLAEIELSEGQQQRFTEIFDKAFRPALDTPRASKRLANVLTFALPLVKGEVDPLDLIFLEALRAFYPPVYYSIRDHREVYLGSIYGTAYTDSAKDEERTKAKALIEAGLKSLPEKQQRAVKVVLQSLFPKTSSYGLYRSEGVVSEDLEKGKRIASEEYLSRYFTYGVQPHDISDNELNEFLKLIPEKDFAFIVETVKYYAGQDRQRAELFIGKLRQSEDDLSAEVAERLAKGLGLCGEIFPKHVPIDRAFGFGASAQASVLIRKLLERITNTNIREEVALELADSVVPLPFAYDYLYWIRPLKVSDYSDEKVAVVSAECESQIKERIVRRIVSEAQEQPIEQKYPIDAQNLYLLWFNFDPDSLREYARQRVISRRESVASFIVGFLGIDPTAKLERLAILEAKEWFETLCKILDRREALEALRKTHPKAFEKSKSAALGELLDAENLAAEWFVQMDEQFEST